MAHGAAYLVCGLAFGDEGKGSVTDFLVRAHAARAVVRFNGGPQAGHNVVAPDGRWHCFAQFGAGSFVPGTRTLLGPQMLVEPENLAVEADVLRAKGVGDALARLVIDPDCAVVTPMHKMIGQMLEIARGRRAVGSCGMGVGQAILDRERRAGVRVRDILVGRAGARRLEELAREKLAQAAELVQTHPSEEMRAAHRYFLARCRSVDLLRSYRGILASPGIAVVRAASELRREIARGAVVFEGAQGALLDGRLGFFPYVTRSRTTAHDAVDLLEAARARTSARVRIGVLRAYGHRHGPGPFVTEDGRLARRFDDPRNCTNRWQGRFRVGRLDLVALRYGLRLNRGVDWLAVTGLDRLTGLPGVRVCASYEYHGDRAELDPYFEWEPLRGGKARILGIRVPATPAPPAPHPGPAGREPDHSRTRVLLRCRPLEWIELPGWRRDVRGARSPADLPAAARGFVEFLESARGLGVPVGLVSVRPDAGGKLVFPASDVP